MKSASNEVFGVLYTLLREDRTKGNHMNQQKTDVVVVGAGIMGASAAWHLARQGLRVTVLEQFDLDHVRGSSHGLSRIFRFAYNDADYVRLVQQALPLWREAEKELGTDLLWTTGALDLGSPQNLAPFAGALSAAGAPFELLSRAELGRRFPAYSLPEGWEALYQPDGGVTHADRARAGFLELARRAGAELKANTKVTRLLPENDRVSIETADGRWHADRVVVTTAAWTNRLLEPLDLAVPMKITREHVAYYALRDSHPVLPFIFHPSDASFEFYGLPNGNRTEVKVGEHKAGPEVDPDTEPVVDQARVESMQRRVRAHLPGLGEEPVASETCLYASTPDDDFVVDQAGPVILGVGFGGHGFKFGPIIGSMLADLVRGKPLRFGARFSRQRFAQPDRLLTTLR